MCKGTNKRAKNKRKTEVFLFISELKNIQCESQRKGVFAEKDSFMLGKNTTSF